MSKPKIYPKDLYPSQKQRNFCVKLAKDIIFNLMKKKNFNVTVGIYCEFDYNKYFKVRDDIVDIYDLNNVFNNSLKKFLKKDNFKNSECSVCALGSFFVARTLEKNEVDIDYTYSVKKLINEIGYLNSTLIESAFERFFCTHWIDDWRMTPEIESLNNSAMRSFESKDARKRLYSICRNIIRNKGIYVPRGYTLK